MKRKALAALAGIALLAGCETPTAATNTTDGQGNNQAARQGIGSSADQQAALPAGLQEEFVVKVGDRVFFATDEHTLTAEGRAVLDRQAAWLAAHPAVTLLVEGHCDERGTREYNLALGERRSNAVREYLQTKGAPAARLTTISYGKERPAVSGVDETAWAKNRRAVSVVK